jgi:transposase
MIGLFREESEVEVSPNSITYAIQTSSWSNKTTPRVARQRNSSLRHLYHYELSKYKSYHLIFIDESGSDTTTAQRRKGWAPRGVAPFHNPDFNREKRHQFIAAYTQDGLMLSRIFQGSADHVMFESFIRQLLRHCGRFPQPKSVLVMDNASFHRPDRLRELCSAAGIKLLVLPPYSPELYPTERYFGEVKKCMRKESYKQEIKGLHFATFLKWCINQVGAKQESAEGHFIHSGITIEYSSE